MTTTSYRSDPMIAANSNLMIGSVRRPAGTGRRFEVLDPATGEVIAVAA